MDKHQIILNSSEYLNDVRKIVSPLAYDFVSGKEPLRYLWSEGYQLKTPNWEILLTLNSEISNWLQDSSYDDFWEYLKEISNSEAVTPYGTLLIKSSLEQKELKYAFEVFSSEKIEKAREIVKNDME